MHVLRLTRTYPNSKFKNVGLQAYMFGKYSKNSSTFFFKKNKHKSIKNRSDTKIHEVVLKERSLSDNYNLNLNFIFVLLNKMINNLNLFFKILKKINLKEISYIHVHNINFLLTAFLLNLFFKKKIVLSIGGSDIYNLKKKILFKILISKVSLVISVSKDLKNKFKRIYPKTNCKVIGNGVDLNYYKFRKLKKNKIILAVGNIRWQKDYLTLIKSFKLFIKKNPSYRLFICGGILEKNEYEKISMYIKENSLSKKIILKGYLSSNQIRNLIYKSKLLVISSISEGLPKVLLEAISCGTPIITTNVGDNVSIIKDKQLSTPKKNALKMSQAINSLIKSKKKYNQTVNNFYLKRNEFSWEKLVLNTEKKIESIVC
tara:strand:+ start:300 stop:1418 length:1119 start_codon:yes stop_codon:yes gene_type:complete